VDSSHPRLLGVYETVLYAPDIAAAAEFYAETLGLTLLEEPNDCRAAFRLEDGAVLLIFDPDCVSVPGRPVPSHGATGPGHVAFAVEPGGLGRFEIELRRRGVDIEHELAWDEGGRSLYLRDPAGNSVELVEGEAWPGRSYRPGDASARPAPARRS
jgi:catechol 2,3-dioxygenase-like lactoylglutathione lyase family enzyme